MLKGKNCVITIFSKIILCAGSLKDRMTIIENELQETTVNQNQAQPQKTELYKLFGRIEGVNSHASYNGVKMTPNTPEGKSSHVVYIPFDQTIYELAINRFFIELERPTRNRMFKMNKLQNYGEQDQYLAIWLNETGFSDLEAAQA